MRATRLLLILPVIIIITIGVISGPGCANIIPPMGGPRDSIAPQLIKVSPGDSTRNFRDARINFTFDEFVELENPQQEILVSPLTGFTPSYDYKLNTVTVKFNSKDTLEPNTTYTINFGKSIKDVDEGNIFKDFTYTFSTGPYIDSLELSGNVILAETGKIDTTLTVMLHTNPDDSAVFKQKPKYIARLDSKGSFIFKNLPPKKYYLYVLADGGSHQYFDDKQLFGFADSAINVSSSVKPVTLYAYNAEQKTTTTGLPLTLNIGNRNNRGGATTNDRRLKFSTNLNNNQQDLLSDFIINFEQPLRVFDSTKLGFFTDSTYKPLTGWHFVKDSTNKKLQLSYAWKENTSYHLVLDKDFAEDTTGKKLLRIDTINFRTKKLADYGKLKIKFRNLELSKNPVLLFILNNAIAQSFPLSSADFAKDLFLPGEYELRILYDTNKNGKWDAGEFFGKHRQPELVKPVDRHIIVKPDWENEFEIAL